VDKSGYFAKKFNLIANIKKELTKKGCGQRCAQPKN